MNSQWKEIEHHMLYGYNTDNTKVRLETPLKTGGPWVVSMTAFGKEVFRTPFMQERGLEEAMNIAAKLVDDHMDVLKKGVKEDNDAYFARLQSGKES